MEPLAHSHSDAAVAFQRRGNPSDAASWVETAPPAVRPPPMDAPPGGTPIARGVARWLAFVGVVAALVFGVDAAINAGLRRITTSSFGATNRLVNGQINAEIIITGSSRAWGHYDPRLIQGATGLSSYNLGRNGSQTDMQLAVLKTYLEHNTKPRLLVHNLDLFSFVASREIYAPAQYFPYLGEKPIYSAISTIDADAWKWKYLPLYGYVVPDMRFTWFLGLKRLVGIQPAEDHIMGFVPRQQAWTEDFANFRRANPHGIVTPVDRQGVRDLEGILKLSRDQGIPMLLVYSPEYVEVQPMQNNRGVIFAQFARLAAEYRIPLWDYSDSPISKQRDYFYNSQHLNAAGAEAFSTDFSQRLAAETGLYTQVSSTPR